MRKNICRGIALICIILLIKKATNKLGLYIKKQKKEIEKFQQYYELLLFWLDLKQNKTNLEDYFNQLGYESIAIYGMGELGKSLFKELNGSSICVKYVIDQTIAFPIDDTLEVYKPDDVLPKVDAIIVTPVANFSSIEKDLMKKNNYPIISLEDAVYEM